jgi:hypothetical protein
VEALLAESSACSHYGARQRNRFTEIDRKNIMGKGLVDVMLAVTGATLGVVTMAGMGLRVDTGAVVQMVCDGNDCEDGQLTAIEIVLAHESADGGVPSARSPILLAGNAFGARDAVRDRQGVVLLADNGNRAGGAVRDVPAAVLVAGNATGGGHGTLESLQARNGRGERRHRA